MCRESAWKRVQVLWDPVLHGMLEWYWCRENVWTGWYIKGLWKWRREICSEFCLQVWRLWWVWNVNFTDRPFTDVCFLLCLLLVIFVRALSRATAKRTETIFCLSAAPHSSTAVNYLACYLNSLQNRRSVDSSLCSSCLTLSPRPSQSSDFGDVSDTNSPLFASDHGTEKWLTEAKYQGLERRPNRSVINLLLARTCHYSYYYH